MVLSRDRGSPLVLSELPTACRLPGPAGKAVVPAKFVVSVFCATRPCRLPSGQCLPPLVFGVFSFFSCSFLLLFSHVLACSCLCAGDLWLVVWCFHATGALPLCSLGCLLLGACPALRRRQSYQPSLLFLWFTCPGCPLCTVRSAGPRGRPAPFVVCCGLSLARFQFEVLGFNLKCSVSI